MEVCSKRKKALVRLKNVQTAEKTLILTWKDVPSAVLGSRACFAENVLNVEHLFNLMQRNAPNVIMILKQPNEGLKKPITYVLDVGTKWRQD